MYPNNKYLYEKWTPLIGRILLGALFVFSGYGKVLNFATTVPYAASPILIPDGMGSIALIIAIIIESGAGLLLILGFKTRISACVLALYTVVVTFLFHAFWASPPEIYQVQLIAFLKNLSITGGFLYVISYGAGKMSLDYRYRKANEDSDTQEIKN